jgi:signal transduction histidine kinase
MLRGLASTGIAVASLTHELRSLSNILVPQADLLKVAMQKFISDDDVSTLDKYDNPYYLLNIIRDNDSKVSQWLSYTLNAIQKKKRDRSFISISDYFEGLNTSWKSSLKQKSISFEILPEKSLASPLFLGYEMDLDSIFNNLISNATVSLLKTDVQYKKISIEWAVENENIVIDFVDNGMGLASEYRDNPKVIFEAFETSTRDKNNNKTGTGMGLYIVKGIIDSYDGASVSLMQVSNGFGIRVVLKLYSNGRSEI